MRGRYSMIGLDPDLVWRCQDGVAEIGREPPRPRAACSIRDERPPLDSLRALIAESAHHARATDLPPMAAGLFGYLGYDMVRLMERLPEPNPDVLGVPDAILIRPTVMVVFDAVRDEISLITPVRPQTGVSAKAAYETRARAARRRDGGARTSAADRRAARPDAARMPSRRSRTRRRPNSRRWSRGRRNTSAPATSSRWCCRSASRPPSRCRAFALYRALRRVNPAPFLCYLDFEDFQIVCSVARDPGARARRQGDDPPDRRHAPARRDRRPRTGASRDELLADPKERAEHLMLLDLGRNDVGRVSRDRAPSRSRTASSSNATAR